MRNVVFEAVAFAHTQEWLAEDKKTLQRIMRMLQECQRTPFEGIGKPEPLKGNYKGYWSRRITDGHRLIYRADDASVVVCSLKGHYE